MSAIRKMAGVGLIALGMILLQSGCMSPGEQLDSSVDLRVGQHQQEVRKKFGSPKRSETDANGRTLDVFATIMPKPDALGQRVRIFEVRSLHVIYDQQGQVVNFVHHIGELRGVQMLNGEWHAGARPAPDKVNAIQRGTTDRTGLVEMFGVATIKGLTVNGDEVLVWQFIEGRGAYTLRGRELLVLMNANSTVRDYMLRDIQP